MMLLFGLISFGRAFTLKIQLTGAAREGARTMAIKKNVGEAKTRTKEHAPLAALADGEIQVSTPTSTTTCPPNERVTVVVTRSFTYDFILFEIGPRDLIGRAVMRCGG
jgi:Flp pilus assembly protein TadG